jgi:hypothetical protein
MPNDHQIAAFEQALGELIVRHGGARNPSLEAQCVAQIVAALAETSADGASLSKLDVVRIRAGKFAATRLPAALYRDAPRLAALRAEIGRIARSFVGDEGAEGSRF